MSQTPARELSDHNKSAWNQLYASTREPIWGTRPVGFLPHHLPVNGALPPGEILDAAAGEGRNLPLLLTLGRPVTACDAAAAALEKIAPELRARVATIECDLAQLPLRDGQFAFILLSDVVETLPEPVAVLRELHRLLVPGGLLLVNIPGDDDGIAGIDMQPAPDRGWLYRGRYYYRFYSRADAEALVTGAGFDVTAGEVSAWDEPAHPLFRPEPHMHRSLVLTARRSAR